MENILFCSFDKKYLPEKHSEGAICWDFKAREEIEIKPGEIKLVPTGIKSALPIGWGYKIYPRSSSPIKRGFTYANNVGIIDSDYRGELFAQVINLKQENITILKDERIGQLEVFPYLVKGGVFGTKEIPKIEMSTDKNIYYDFENQFLSDRGEGGFGSTGTH